MKKENKFNFTKDKLLSITISGSRVRYYDIKVAGLILDVLPSGKKSFRVYKKIKGKPSPVNVTLGSFPDMTIEQARKHAHKKLNQIAENINPNIQLKVEKKKQITLIEVFEDYKRDRTLTAITLRGYNQIMSCYFEDWHNKPISKITETMVSDRHKLLTKRSKSQADCTMRVLKAIVNYAINEYKTENDEKLFTSNPVEIINHKRQWNNVQRKNTRLKQKQFKPWFEGVIEIQNDPNNIENMDHNTCLFLQMALLTGLRKEELLTLKWKDVDFEEKMYLIVDPKNHLSFELPLSNYLYDILHKHRVSCNAKEQYVFYTKNNYGYIREPKKIVQKVIKKTQIDFNLHDLRRTFASIAESLNLGTSYTLKRLLNQKTGRNDVTAGYTILTAEELREPAQKIENKILELAGLKESSNQINEQVLELLKKLSKKEQLELISTISNSH